jgi:ribonuclease P protein subunit RPR2
MSKRHLPKNAAAQIGNERIRILIVLADKAVREGKDDRATRYVALAKQIGMKTRTNVPSDFKYCKECSLPMIPGINCTVRLTEHKIVSTCAKCGTIKRMPYLREQIK